MTDDATDADRTAADVAWDLEPLVDGRRRRRRRRAPRRRRTRAADAIADAYRGRIAELDAAGLADADARAWPTIAELDRPGRLVRRAALRGRHHRPRAAARCSRAPRSGRPRSATSCSSSSSSGPRSPTSSVEPLLADPALDVLPPLPRARRAGTGRTCSPSPRSGSSPRRPSPARSAWARLFGELTSAITVDARRREPSSLEEGLSRLAVARPRGRAGRGRGGHRGPRARAAHPRVHLQHAARRQGDRRPAAPLRRLAREPQPRQRGERRVGAGARRRGRRPLRHPAALVRAEGAAARRRPARRLRPHGVGRRRRGRRSAGPTRSELVLDAYASFSPELADVAQRFFDERWIDAPVRPGKRPGAFCAYTVPSHHPYLLLNWTARRRDVLTLAHELGHGLHAYLAREPGRVPPVDAAHAGRDRVGVRRDGHVRAPARRDRPIPTARLALLAESLEGQIATVFRQIAMNRFEDARAHRAARARASCRVDRFGELWAETQTDDARRRGRDHRGLPHVVVVHPALHRARPGTCTPTRTASCSRCRVYRQYEERGAEFVPAYLELLSRGRLDVARGARADRRLRPRRPGVLGRRARDHRGAARRGRAAAATRRRPARPLQRRDPRPSSSLELVEAHRAELERACVERLQVERRAARVARARRGRASQTRSPTL